MFDRRTTRTEGHNLSLIDANSVGGESSRGHVGHTGTGCYKNHEHRSPISIRRVSFLRFISIPTDFIQLLMQLFTVLRLNDTLF